MDRLSLQNNSMQYIHKCLSRIAIYKTEMQNIFEARMPAFSLKVCLLW